jgi:hypothetical protein
MTMALLLYGRRNAVEKKDGLTVRQDMREMDGCE